MIVKYHTRVTFSGSVDLRRFFSSLSALGRQHFHQFNPAEYGYDEGGLSDRICAFVLIELEDELEGPYSRGFDTDITDADWDEYPEITEADAQALAEEFPWMLPETPATQPGPGQETLDL